MNERIKELVKQSLVWNDEGDECDVDLSKFAELIIRECADVCRCRVVVDSDYNKGRTDCQTEIKEHFGVKC